MGDVTDHPGAEASRAALKAVVRDIVHDEVRAAFRNYLHINPDDAKSLHELNADLDWTHRSRKAGEATGLWAKRALVTATVGVAITALVYWVRGGHG